MAEDNVLNLLNERNQMLENQRKLYLTTVINLNMRYNKLLKDDFGNKLVKNCASDVAGEIVRRYFDTSDYYITVDQMYDRIVHFSYDGGSDPLAQYSDAIRKNLYNMADDPQTSKTLQNISKSCQEAQTKLFNKEDTDKNGKTGKKYIDKDLMEKGKEAYREQKRDPEGKLRDELSGNSSDDERLEVDHIQAAATARYNSEYLNTPEAIQALKEFYNSPENFQMLEKRANASKGDVRVYADGNRPLSKDEVAKIRKDIKEKLTNAYISEGMDEKEAKKKAANAAEEEITKKYDITYKASAKQVADAVCQRWENTPKEETKENLIRTGKLTKDGKVPDEVRKKLEENLRKSMNAESRKMLRYWDYKKTGKAALSETQKGLSKIIAGQVIYYVLPPVVFESRQIIRKKQMTLERFCEELTMSGKRIVKYVENNLGRMLKNIMGNSANKFLKTFFDIIIESVKETVKRLVKAAKQLVLSLLQCVKIMGSSNSTKAEKADAVTRTLSVTVTSIVLEVLFEYMEKQFGLPDIIMEPLQLIVTIIATNTVMLVLEKADFFDVKYGLLVENIDSAFREEQEFFENSSKELFIQSKLNMESGIEKIKDQLYEIQMQMKAMDFYEEDAAEQLNKINEIYNMGIDFDKEWLEFCAFN